ncbi:hypothetical protein NDI49_23610 [Trichocoleus sp. ST-U3]|uniref:hypothetical protein n=1 Tax=Coleofasciculus sp. FACHB-542 TaxID=2692787 RepID=UPI0016896F64|nr:hypothetical protein [Coleofasciculus sp. FACHB-542]MBD2083454.1 hypothetical protein [Coleofasciculus sp. FACHB-542]
MTFTLNNKGSDERYLQPDLLAVVASTLPKVDDPTEFLKEFNKFLGFNREVQQTKTEAEAEACKQRLIAIILGYAEKQGFSSKELPRLKDKSYEQLCEYIKKSWPALITSI